MKTFWVEDWCVIISTMLHGFKNVPFCRFHQEVAFSIKKSPEQWRQEGKWNNATRFSFENLPVQTGLRAAKETARAGCRHGMRLRGILDFKRSRNQRQSAFLWKCISWSGFPLPSPPMVFSLWYVQDWNARKAGRATMNTPRRTAVQVWIWCLKIHTRSDFEGESCRSRLLWLSLYW